MKKIVFFFICCLTCIFSSCLLSLEKEGITDTTIFKGRVIDDNGQPLNGVMIRITNNEFIYNSTTTNPEGVFEIAVRVAEIDTDYYLKIGDVKELTLKGFGREFYDAGDIIFSARPIVHTKGVSSISLTSFTCVCEVVSQGCAEVIERGLCYSINIPTVDDNILPFGRGEGIYYCTVHGVDIKNTTYYARAYAKNEYGIGYGDAIEISSGYFTLPTMQYGGYTYRLHPDLGGMTWEQAKGACEDLNAYGYDDWFLPTKEEMLAIAENTNILTNNLGYWTSTSYDANRHYRIVNYNIDWYNDRNIFHVIPARKYR